VVAETIGDEQLAAVDRQRARPVEAGRAIAAFGLAALADLQQELSVLREFEHLRVGWRWRTCGATSAAGSSAARRGVSAGAGSGSITACTCGWRSTSRAPTCRRERGRR
jgi:hypothetical protein